MRPPDPIASDATRVMLGCFEVRGRPLAIEVSQLREVVRFEAATPLPGAPASIEGVIDLRGVLVPVVDLGRLLGSEALRAGPRARIAVAEIDGLAIGLAVDAALEIISVDAAALGDPPALAVQSGCEATRAIVRRPAEPPLAVLSLEHLVAAIHRAAFPSAEVAP